MKFIFLDPKLCPDECKTMCVSPPRKTPGRRNKHRNGYCYNWCANVDNPNLHTNNGKYGYCGVSGAIKENSIDCRGCWSKFSNILLNFDLNALRYKNRLVFY